MPAILDTSHCCAYDTVRSVSFNINNFVARVKESLDKPSAEKKNSVVLVQKLDVAAGDIPIMLNRPQIAIRYTVRCMPL